MGYWIVADRRDGSFVAESDTRREAEEFAASDDRDLEVVPYYEFYGLGSGS